jgi:chaperonin GroES
MNEFNYGKPFGTRVIIKADDEIEQTAAGIIIPETARERPQFGTVLQVGPKVTEDVKVGDRVVYGKNAGVPLLIGNVQFFVMQERELFMVLDQGEVDKAVAAMLTADVRPKKSNSFVITADKSSYKVGEEMVLTVDAAADAKSVTFDIEYKQKGKLLDHLRHSGTKGMNTIKLLARDNMVPEFSIEMALSEKFTTKSSDMPIVRNGLIKIEVYK